MINIESNKILLIATAMFFKIFGALSLLAINYLITNNYGLEKVAELGVLTSSLMLTAFVSKAGLDIYTIKHVSRATEISKALVAGLIIILAILFSAFTSSVYYIFSQDLYFSVLIFLFGIFSVLPEIIRANGDIIKYSAIRNFCVNFLFLLLLSFCSVMELDLNVVFAYLISISAVLLICFYVFINCSIPVTFSMPRVGKIKEVLSESIYMQISSFCIYLLGSFSILILSFFKEKEEVAAFYICMQLALVFNMITTTIGMLYGPLLSKSYMHNRGGFKYKYLQASLLNFIFLLPPFLLYTMFGDKILVTLFEVRDNGAYIVLMALSFGLFVSGLVGPKYAALNMTGHHKHLVKLMVIVVAIGVVANVINASLFSVSVFAFTMAFCNILLSLSCFYIIVRKVF